MHDRAPNGWFLKDLIIFNNLGNGGYFSKGFRIEVPELRNASEGRKEEAMLAIRNWLVSHTPDTRIQLQWTVDSNYNTALEKYRLETERLESNKWSTYERNERYLRYAQKIENRQLRREHLIIFISKKINSNEPLSKKKLLGVYEKSLEQMQAEMDERYLVMRQAFGSGTTIKPMTDIEHYLYYRNFLNPSQNDNSKFNYETLFDPQYTIQDLCWNCDIVPNGKEAKQGFYLDGYHHYVFVLKRWPTKTYACLYHRLTSLPFLDYSVTVNIDPLDTQNEIKQEEKKYERIKGSYLSEGKHSQRTHMDKKARKIDSLAQGHSFPFDVLYTIRTWAKNETELYKKVAAIKDAVNSMNGAQTYECALPSSAKKSFFASWPAWTWSSYDHRKLYAEDEYLADVLPFSSTFVGYLEENPEALYEGSNNNLVGIKTFIGNTPQNIALFGMSRVGKSALMLDYLTQTEPYYTYTAIIEEGLSYGIYTQLCGDEPIIIQPDSDLTFNYFDTQNAPLNQTHLATIVALVATMIGKSSSRDLQQVREAQISEYIQQIYKDRFETWKNKNYELIPTVARRACAALKYKKEKASHGATFLESYIDLSEWLQKNNDESQNFLASITEEEITRMIKDPKLENVFENTAYSFFKPEDFPQHAQLQEMMMYDPMEHHKKEEVQHLSSLLAPWCRNGSYGNLFDGVLNFSLKKSKDKKSKIAHFELGYIPEAAETLKAAAALLINGFVRQHIITLPRGQRKRMIFEEAGRFQDIPNGDKIIAECYSQLSKFSCATTSIVQQYAKFKNSNIRVPVIGNSKQFMVMRQVMNEDIEDLNKDINLPDTTKAAIMQFPEPTKMPKDPYSSLCYYVPTADPPLCGTIQYRASKEMLYASSSTGSDFEKRSKELKQEKDIFTGVLKHANVI